MPTRIEIDFIKWWGKNERGGEILCADIPSDTPRDHFRCWLGGHVGPVGPGPVLDEVYGPDRLVLNPRGADLVATAKGMDLDALVADDELVREWIPTGPNIFDPELVDCKPCRGHGRIPVVIDSTAVSGKLVSDRVFKVWDMGCRPCGGSGKVRPFELTPMFTFEPSGLDVFDPYDTMQKLHDSLGLKPGEVRQGIERYKELAREA